MLACHPRSGSPCCGSSTARRVPLPQAWAAAARRKSQLRLNSTKHSTRTSPATSSASNFGSATPPSSLIHSYRFSQDGSRVHRARSSLQLGQQLTAELGGPPPPAGAATSCSPTSSPPVRPSSPPALPPPAPSPPALPPPALPPPEQTDTSAPLGESSYLGVLAGKTRGPATTPVAGSRGRRARSNCSKGSRSRAGTSSGEDAAELQYLEVEIVRPTPSSTLGITCDPAHAGDGSVVVSALADGGVAARSGALFVGDTICTVCGTAVTDPVQCARLLRGSGERVTLEVVLSTQALLSLVPPAVPSVILSTRPQAGGRQYLVRWSPSDRRTWAKPEELVRCPGGAEMCSHFESSCRTFDVVVVPLAKGGLGIELEGNVVSVPPPRGTGILSIQVGDVVAAVDGQALCETALAAALARAAAATTISVIRPSAPHANPRLQQAEIAAEMHVVKLQNGAAVDAKRALKPKLEARPGIAAMVTRGFLHPAPGGGGGGDESLAAADSQAAGGRRKGFGFSLFSKDKRGGAKKDGAREEAADTPPSDVVGIGIAASSGAPPPGPPPGPPPMHPPGPPPTFPSPPPNMAPTVRSSSPPPPIPAETSAVAATRRPPPGMPPTDLLGELAARQQRVASKSSSGPPGPPPLPGLRTVAAPPPPHGLKGPPRPPPNAPPPRPASPTPHVPATESKGE